jgi:hypothetical protein
MPPPFEISIAGEGIIDHAAARRLIEFVGAIPGAEYGGQGKPHLAPKIPGYNAAAEHGLWFVLIDLDRSPPRAKCAPSLRLQLAPALQRFMCLRIVVMALEAWLMADAKRFSSFFRVPIKKVPSNPEGLPDPKQTVLDLVRGSKNSSIRADILPRNEENQRVGPGYASKMIQFITDEDNGWRPEIAATRASSLARTIERLREVINRYNEFENAL